MLAHVLDCATEEPGRDPLGDIDVIEAELAQYGGLADRPRLVVLNKVDVPAARELADMVRPMLEERGLTVFEISAATHEGLRPLSFALAELVAAARAAAPAAEPTRLVLRPEAIGGPEFTVEALEDGGYLVRGSKPERWIAQTRFDNDEAVGYLADRLAKLGVEKALAEAGAEAGAEVTIGDVTFDWQPSLDGCVRCPGRAGPTGGWTGWGDRFASGRGQGRLVVPDQRGRGLDRDRVDTLVDALEGERARGGDVVLVSSGAIAAGLAPLGLTGRPRDLATLQAAASVGQTQLVERYAASFGRYGRTVGQVLLTVDDVVRRAHYKNAQRTLDRLIQLGVVPVINENDTVATHEIRFGDNDRLAALVAHLVQADLLVLLSDIDGLYDSDPRLGDATLIPRHRRRGRSCRASRSAASGPQASVRAACPPRSTPPASPPLPAFRSSWRPPAPPAAALSGETVGTRFTATARRAPTRLLWLAHASEPAGRLRLDPGAVAAVVERRLSLLPAGITGAEGLFSAGDPVDLLDENGHARARGLVNYDSGELPGMLGRSTRELAARLGPAYEREVVHRDDIVLLP